MSFYPTPSRVSLDHPIFSVRTLERARASGSFENNEALENNIKSDMSSHESTDNENEVEDSRRNKRMKTSTY